MIKKTIVPLTLIALLAACGDTDEDTQPNESEQGEDSNSSDSYTVTDDRGVEVTFDEKPTTIVSLIPSNTEIIFALGEGENVVGVTDTDVYPEEVADIEVVASFEDINIERLLELDPDVIIGYTYSGGDQMAPLEDVGLPVFAIDSATSFSDVFDDIDRIAEVLHVEDSAQPLIERIQAQLDEVADIVSEVDEKQIYFEISPSPELFTPGSETFQHEIIEAAGLENVFSDLADWAGISEEQVIERNPELIATTVHYVDDSVEEIKQRSGWDSIDAVINDDVYLLSADIMDRPGPRIGEAVQELAETAYPNLFE
ncbi:iron complex transport system substrate-binding protein [Alkalihalobacillus xiaoxiensis]|uniref:Iron complex transport system substrate-binding protein n=1 Tax=Shouchella xiaoxiensis TaxID=766895 RepID=A0ABS2SYD3_9BACI|nr:ABC transporter substrate-binding protein [Shouchella xiaoxiensis]MBM7840529.1 iron complex transport system substrate-binding protein [Shouchella xiaoxiensis]